MDCSSWEPYSASPSHGSSTQFIATQKVFPGSSPSRCLEDRVGQIGNRWENRVGDLCLEPQCGSCSLHDCMYFGTELSRDSMLLLLIIVYFSMSFCAVDLVLKLRLFLLFGRGVHASCCSK